MKTIEARGLICPKPIIMAKSELDTVEAIEIYVNESAVEDLGKLATAIKATCETKQLKEDEYLITIVKTEDSDALLADVKVAEGTYTIIIQSNKMGEGADEVLGKKLMKSFLYTVSEATPLPTTMIFYNSGVYLTIEGSEVLEDLQKLEEAGVEIMSCGTCLDYHEIKDDLAVGIVSNMYTIYETMRDSEKTIIL